MKAILSALALIATLVPATSQAFVQQVALCKTSDNPLQISVQNNEGTGFDRSMNLVATVQDAQGNVIASMPVEMYHGIQPVSFARATYIDVATQGSQLVLQGPSTNEHNYIVRLNTQARAVNDQNVNCSAFYIVQ